MNKPNQDVLTEAERAAKAYPRLREYFAQCYASELEALPHARTDVALKQGRCQILSELLKLFNPDPSAMMAKPIRTPSSTHTDRSV